MQKTVKFAVSVSQDEFKELEALRKKKGKSRSEFIRESLKLWKEKEETVRLVRMYEEGYKKAPENLAIAEAWEKASLSSFPQEEW